MLMNTTATDDAIDVVSRLVAASAITDKDGNTRGMRIPKDASHTEVLEHVQNLSTTCPNALVQLENTDFYEAWGPTAEATCQLEMIHAWTAHSPLFELPPALPPIDALSSYQMVVMLEDNVQFTWCRLPAKQEQRLAIAYLPQSVESPRFWCSGKAKIDHMYLRCLVTAAAETRKGIMEVNHGQDHAYYLELLGLDVTKRTSGKLAVDDGGEFPDAKRRRDLALEDSEALALAIEDGDGEALASEDSLEEAIGVILDDEGFGGGCWMPT